MGHRSTWRSIRGLRHERDARPQIELREGKTLMESLALLVMILLLSAILSGPIAYGLTYVRVHSRKWFFARRIGVVLLALWGALTALQFAISNLAPFPRIMGVAGVAISLLALKREFKVHTLNE